MVTQHGYDRVLGLETISIFPGGERSVTNYDGFGRVLSLQKPDPVNIGVTDTAATSITYQDTSYGQLVHTTQTGGPGYPANDTLVYQDAFGRTIQVISTGDSTLKTIGPLRTGDPRRSWARDFLERTDLRLLRSERNRRGAAALPRGHSVRTAGRRTTCLAESIQASDIDGTVVSATAYHAMSVDSFDAETVKASGLHAGAFVTAG